MIFETIARMIRAHQPADVITVFEALRDAGQAEAVGGMAYLNDLSQSVPGAANVHRYAAIVSDKALSRALAGAAEKIATLASEATGADEALDAAQTLLAGLKRTKARGEPRRLGDLMPARIDHWQALAAGDATPGIPTGLPTLDKALGGGIKPGKVIVLAARPSVGKTSLAQHIGMHVAAAGHSVLMLSQEMAAAELADRAMASQGGVPLDRLTTGGLADEDWAAVAAAGENFAALPFYVDDQPALTLLDIRAKAREVKRRAGLVLLIVDYLQLCSSAGGAFEKRHHQIEQISRGMKALAKEAGVCVLLLSQLKRDAGDEPELDHLKESGAIEEDADTVVLLHPMGEAPAGRLLVLAKVAKNRGGSRGRLALAFDGKTQRWASSRSSVARRIGRGGGA
ncbi:MAG: replicative DNA helicase [Burkholderiales bacterium PBB5]|nr:MAG: replicative DNA helicase [Burkholderiales bacterium PBB5]